MVLGVLIGIFLVVCASLATATRTADVDLIREAAKLERAGEASKAKLILERALADADVRVQALANYRLGMGRYLGADNKSALSYFLAAKKGFKQSGDDFGECLSLRFIELATPPEQMIEILNGTDGAHKDALLEVSNMRVPAEARGWDRDLLSGAEELKEFDRLFRLAKATQDHEVLITKATSSWQRVAKSNLLMQDWASFDVIDFYGLKGWDEGGKRFTPNSTSMPRGVNLNLRHRSGAPIYVRLGSTNFGLVAFVYTRDGCVAFASGQATASSMKADLKVQIQAASSQGDWRFLNTTRLWIGFFSHVFDYIRTQPAGPIFWQNARELTGFNPLALWTGKEYALLVLGDHALLLGAPMGLDKSERNNDSALLSLTYSAAHDEMPKLEGVERERDRLSAICSEHGIALDAYTNDGYALAKLRPRSGKQAEFLYLAGHMEFGPNESGPGTDVSVLTSDGFVPLMKILGKVYHDDGKQMFVPPVVFLSGCSSLRANKKKRQALIDSEEFGCLAALYGLGADTVVGSLWPMNDKSGASILGDTFAKIASGKMAIAQALLDSQRAYLRVSGAPAGETTVRSDSKSKPPQVLGDLPAKTHPYFWANIVVRGIDR